MTRMSLFFASMFLAGACGGSDAEPKGPSTTQVAAPEEKSEEDIKMSPGSPEAPAKKPAPESKPAPETKPATGTKPAEPAKPAPPPK